MTMISSDGTEIPENVFAEYQALIHERSTHKREDGSWKIIVLPITKARAEYIYLQDLIKDDMDRIMYRATKKEWLNVAYRIGLDIQDAAITEFVNKMEMMNDGNP